MSQPTHISPSTSSSRSNPPLPGSSSLPYDTQVNPHTLRQQTPGQIDRQGHRTTDQSRDIDRQAPILSVPISGPTQPLGHPDQHRRIHQPRLAQNSRHTFPLEPQSNSAQCLGQGIDERYAFSDPQYQHLPSSKGHPVYQHSNSIPGTGLESSEYSSGFWRGKRRTSQDGSAFTSKKPITTSRLGLAPRAQQERRREQNRVAQRKFRAKAKILESPQSAQQSSAAETH
jgi:hypothetical protein